MEFNKKIKLVREKLGISQETLARKIGVSFATINRLEANKCFPSFVTLKNFDDFCKENSIVFDEVKNDE